MALRMEEIRQELLAAGVIGRVVDDFNPQIIIRALMFGLHKRINSGAEVLFADVQELPVCFGFDFDREGPSFSECFSNLSFITAIMTDPNAPGGEYLHWMATTSSAIGNSPGCWQDVAPYEPPKPIVTRMFVFTLFKQNEPPNFRLNSRENFSTRRFAEANALGPPVTAAFYRIKNENEEQDTQSDVIPPSICSTARTCSKRAGG
eukprot:PITA_06565